MNPQPSNLPALLTGGPTRLCYVNRFSGCHVSHLENVAEHSWLVGMYAILIGIWCQDRALIPDGRQTLGELSLRALMHDVEEAESGDFPRPFKYSNEKLTEMLNEAGHDAFMKTFEGTVPAERINYLRRIWDNAKHDNTPYAKLIKFCDFLSVVSYSMREGPDRNIMLRNHLGDLLSYAESFMSKDYDFIRPWVVQALMCCHKIIGTAYDPSKFCDGPPEGFHP